MPLVEKRPGAPAGTINVTIAGGTYLFNDTTATQVNVTDLDAFDELSQHPYLRAVGGGATYVDTTIQAETYDGSGRLSTITIDGVTATIAYVGSTNQINTVSWPDGTVETYHYDGSGRITSISTPL